jgi:mannose-6-phosphate isomerase-like protein (cupin superfamily)
MSFKLRTADTADRDTDRREWGSLCWLAGRSVGNADGLTLGRVVIRPGERNPAHRHGNCEEALYLLAGRLRHVVGDEEVMLSAGDTLVVPPGTNHYAVNVGDEDADMIVAYSSGERGFEPAD